MDEEKTQIKPETETAEAENNIGDNEEAKEEDEEEEPTLINQATKAAKLMKDENDRKEKLLEKEERLIARRLLGGSTEAGMRPITPEEKDQAEAESVASSFFP